jgi:hypothetical protein
VAKEVCDFVSFYGIKLLNSSPYYAQANGQAESSNRTLIKLIKKKIETILKYGMRYYLWLCGLIVFLDMCY